MKIKEVEANKAIKKNMKSYSDSSQSQCVTTLCLWRGEDLTSIFQEWTENELRVSAQGQAQVKHNLESDFRKPVGLCQSKFQSCDLVSPRPKQSQQCYLLHSGILPSQLLISSVAQKRVIQRIFQSPNGKQRNQ
jgi:hypothetical protein